MTLGSLHSHLNKFAAEPVIPGLTRNDGLRGEFAQVQTMTTQGDNYIFVCHKLKTQQRLAASFCNGIVAFNHTLYPTPYTFPFPKANFIYKKKSFFIY